MRQQLQGIGAVAVKKKYNQYRSVFQISTMSERKIWKQEEDQILKELYEQRGVKKWSEIARLMERDYGVEGRNGKQCRERYHNHLKGGISKQKWTPQEERRLVELHSEHGNRWALISKLIPGRTENCVKNMLYSKLRKAVRQLNRFSFQFHRKLLKEIKISFIYRLVEFTEGSYQRPVHARTPQQITALRIKNQILRMEVAQGEEVGEGEREGLRQLVEDIHLFKRTNQRFRGSHGAKGSRGGNRRRRVSQAVEAEERDAEDEGRGGSGQEVGVDGDDSRMQGRAEQRQPEVEHSKLEEQGIKTRESLQSKPPSMPSQLSISQQPVLTRKLRSKTSAMRMDSLESNLSAFLVDKGLQRPIQVDNPFFNLTPTPQRPTPNYEDWTSVLSSWRPHFQE